MNAKTAKMIRAAAGYRPGVPEYEEAKLHRVLQMPAFETYERTIREMGPVSPGAPTNARRCYSPGAPLAQQWIPRAGNRRMVTSRVVEKIRYLTDGKTPAKPLYRQNADTQAWEPVYILIPCQKPRHLKAGSPRRVYKELKRLEQRIGLDALYQRLESEQFDGLVGT